MRFYLGTHMPHWLADSTIPLFVSHRTLRRRKTLPRAACRWALDSGGFSELQMHGMWTIAPEAYVAAVRRYRDEIGNLDFAAPQDWMCEPFMLQRTGLSVQEHQQLTVENYITLRTLAPDLPFIPVLQGWASDDYLRHVEMYDQACVNLWAMGHVGVGTVCRRQSTREGVHIIRVLASAGLRLHGFGFKKGGLAECAGMLTSADSMAWSYAGRRTPDPSGRCKNLANSRIYAMQWYRELTEKTATCPASYQQAFC